MRSRIRAAFAIVTVLLGGTGGPLLAQSAIGRAPYGQIETLVARAEGRVSTLRRGKLSQRRAEQLCQLLLQDVDELAQNSEGNTQLAIRTPFIRQSAGEVGDAVMAGDRKEVLRATAELKEELRDFRVFLAVAEGRRPG